MVPLTKYQFYVGLVWQTQWCSGWSNVSGRLTICIPCSSNSWYVHGLPVWRPFGQDKQYCNHHRVSVSLFTTSLTILCFVNHIEILDPLRMYTQEGQPSVYRMLHGQSEISKQRYETSPRLFTHALIRLSSHAMGVAAQAISTAKQEVFKTCFSCMHDISPEHFYSRRHTKKQLQYCWNYTKYWWLTILDHGLTWLLVWPSSSVPLQSSVCWPCWPSACCRDCQTSTAWCWTLYWWHQRPLLGQSENLKHSVKRKNIISTSKWCHNFVTSLCFLCRLLRSVDICTWRWYQVLSTSAILVTSSSVTMLQHLAMDRQQWSCATWLCERCCCLLPKRTHIHCGSTHLIICRPPCSTVPLKVKPSLAANKANTG